MTHVQRQIASIALALATWILVERPSAAADASFDSKGVKIHYRVDGDGEPVVLIHGFAINGTTQWVLPGIVKSLAKDFRVITIDNRGHGLSEKPHDATMYGLELVEDVARLLDHLKIDKAHIVGYSMGGLIALKFVITHPERVISATLGGMGLLRPTQEPMLAELADALENGKGFGPLLHWLTPPGRARAADHQVAFANKVLLASNDSKAMAALMRGALDAKLDITDEELNTIRAPMIAIVGDMDPLKKHVDELKKSVPALRVVVVPGDHFGAVFSPIFLRSVTNHLLQHRANARKVGAG
jgi:pimeloyl-ACP methyl ester carboxylesterase